MRNELTNIFPEAEVLLDGFHWITRWKNAFSCGKDHISFKVFFSIMSFAVYSPDMNSFLKLLNNVSLEEFDLIDSSELEAKLMKKIKNVTKCGKGKIATKIQSKEHLQSRIITVTNCFKELATVNKWVLNEEKFNACLKRQLSHLDCLSKQTVEHQVLSTHAGINYERATGACEALNAAINALLRKFSHLSPKYLHALILRLVEWTNAKKDCQKYCLTGLKAPILQAEVVLQLNSLSQHLLGIQLVPNVTVQPLNCDEVFFGVESRPLSCDLSRLHRHAFNSGLEDVNLLKKLSQTQTINREAPTFKLNNEKWLSTLCHPFKLPMHFNSKEKEFFQIWKRSLDYTPENNLGKVFMDWSLEILRTNNCADWMKPKEATHFRAFFTSSKKEIVRPRESASIIANALRNLVGTLPSFATVCRKPIDEQEFYMTRIVQDSQVPIFNEYFKANKVLPLMTHAPLRPEVQRELKYIETNVKLGRIRRKYPHINWRLVCCKCGKSKAVQHTRASGFGVNCSYPRAALPEEHLRRSYPKSAPKRDPKGVPKKHEKPAEVKLQNKNENTVRFSQDSCKVKRFKPAEVKPQRINESTVRSSQGTSKVKRYKPAEVNAPSREINSLLPGQLVTNFAIDDYLALVQKAIKKEDVLILPTTYYNFAFRKDFAEAKNVFQNAVRRFKKSKGALQRFLIPCWKSSHWYFIEVNIRRRKMNCYNSLDGSSYNHAEDYELLKSCLFYQNISDNETYETSEDFSRKQGNSVDCGVFTIEGGNSALIQRYSIE